MARRNHVNPEITDRFEFFIGGREIGNGFSELNDAEDQAERFQEQVNAKAAGDDEAMLDDEIYVTALEDGLAANAGLGYWHRPNDYAVYKQSTPFLCYSLPGDAPSKISITLC
ncbi:amino acid--tRNA ligase-related protein [Shigella boydii]